MSNIKLKINCKHVFSFFVLCFDVLLHFPVKIYVRFVFSPICFVGGHVIFIYVYWLSKQFPHQMMFMSFNNNIKGVTSEAGTATFQGWPPQFTSRVLGGYNVAQSLIFCVVFCISLFVLFLLAIVLSVHLQFTASDYPFCIFKPFLFFL